MDVKRSRQRRLLRLFILEEGEDSAKRGKIRLLSETKKFRDRSKYLRGPTKQK